MVMLTKKIYCKTCWMNINKMKNFVRFVSGTGEWGGGGGGVENPAPVKFSDYSQAFLQRPLRGQSLRAIV